MKYLASLQSPDDQYNDKPHKIMPPGGKTGRVRIIKPADPAKLAAYRKEKKLVGDKRVAAGLTRRSENDERRRGIYT